MARAIRFHEAGGPDVLRWEEVEVSEPGPGEARVRHVAAGVNFADVSIRRGVYPTPLPSGIGVEGAGVVMAVGAGVTHLASGDRVAYGWGPQGSYSTERTMPAHVLAKLPEGIAFETAAGVMSAGLTAGYLVRRIWPSLKAGDPILLHAAAGGVGLVATQWAKALGLTVIGTVGSEAKVEVAKAAGCDHVILYSSEDVAARVRELTGGAGVAVAYDSIGKDTFKGSLDSVRRRGLLVSFGAASGPPPAVEGRDLVARGSLFMTRPGLTDYLSDPAECAELVGELFDHVEAGRIKVSVNQRYPLHEAAHAHRSLEARTTTGSTILVV